MDRKILLALGLIIAVVAGYALWLFAGEAEGEGFEKSGDPPIEGGTKDEPSHAPRREAGPGVASETPAVDGDRRVEFTEAAIVSGRVLQEEAGAPAAGALIRLLVLGGATVGETACDDDGRFELPAPSQESDLCLQAAQDGRVSKILVDLELATGEKRDLGDLILEASLEIRGQVRASDGKSLADAEVLLLPNIPMSELASMDFLRIFRALIEDDEPLAERRSDEKGSFIFEGVTPGEYALVVQATDHQMKFSDRIIIQAGQAPAKVELSLERGRRLEGRVTNEEGEAVPGALIALLPDSNGMPGLIRTVKARSDADGHYEIDILGPGRHNLLCRAEGYSPWGDRITIEEKTVADVRLLKGRDLKGRVRDRDSDAGIAGVVLVAIQNKAPVMIEATTDTEGRFVLEHMPEDDRSAIIVRKDGMKVVESPGVEVQNGPFSFIQFKKDENGVLPDELNIYMSGGGEISGQVIDVETGVGIAEARVFVMNSRDFELAMMSSSTGVLTDTEGRFRLLGVSPGPWKLAAIAAGYLMSEPVSSEDLRGQQEDWQRIESGQVVVEQTVGMVRGQTQSGRVVDAEGRKAPGAVVFWHPDESQENRRDVDIVAAMDPRGLKGMVTDEDGRFEIVGLPRDRALAFEAEHPAFPGGGTVVVEAGTVGHDEIKIKLRPGATIEGQLRSESGGAMKGITISLERRRGGRGMIDLRPRNTQLQMESDGNGRFRFEDLAAGRYRAEFDGLADHRLPSSFDRDIRVDGAETRTLDIVLLRDWKISGQLHDEGGLPVRRRYLFAQAEDPGGIVVAEKESGLKVDRGASEAWVRTDNAGSFTFTGLDGRFSYRVITIEKGQGPWSRRRGRSLGSTATATKTEAPESPPEAELKQVSVGRSDIRLVIPSN